jgi:hypothetical protein
MMSLTLHFMGEFSEARRFIERILQHPLRRTPLEHGKVFYIDLEIATHTATFRRSLALARRQNALSWELRTATSLAWLWKDQRRVGEARELLAAIRNRFDEGVQTRDCSRADALLQELRASES